MVLESSFQKFSSNPKMEHQIKHKHQQLESTIEQNFLHGHIMQTITYYQNLSSISIHCSSFPLLQRPTTIIKKTQINQHHQPPHLPPLLIRRPRSSQHTWIFAHLVRTTGKTKFKRADVGLLCSLSVKWLLRQKVSLENSTKYGCL